MPSQFSFHSNITVVMCIAKCRCSPVEPHK